MNEVATFYCTSLPNMQATDQHWKFTQNNINQGNKHIRLCLLRTLLKKSHDTKLYHSLKFWFWHLLHYLLQFHGCSHVPTDLQLAPHEGHRGAKLAGEHGYKITRGGLHHCVRLNLTRLGGTNWAFSILQIQEPITWNWMEDWANVTTSILWTNELCQDT